VASGETKESNRWPVKEKSGKGGKKKESNQSSVISKRKQMASDEWQIKSDKWRVAEQKKVISKQSSVISISEGRKVKG
jgi:hypothetical protein